MEAVVVLPCVPATAMQRLREAMAASVSARSATGMPRRRASTISGLSAGMADDTVTTSAPPRLSAAWPTRHADAGHPQALGHRRGLEVAAGHRVPHGVQDGGDGAHAGATDAHHVHGQRAAQIAQRAGPRPGSHRDLPPAAARRWPRPPGPRRRRRPAGPPRPRPGPWHRAGPGRPTAGQPARRGIGRRSRDRGAAPRHPPARAPGRWPSGDRRAPRGGEPGSKGPRPRPARPRSSPPPDPPPGRPHRRPPPCAPGRAPAPAGRPAAAGAHRGAGRYSSQSRLPTMW